jgi:hypothetical protein
MAIEVTEDRSGNIGPQRVQNIVEGGRGLKRRHRAFEWGQIAADETEGQRG